MADVIYLADPSPDFVEFVVAGWIKTRIREVFFFMHGAKYFIVT